MQALILTKYSDPPKAHLAKVPTPEPKEGEVLIKIKASAVNDYDYSISTGKPKIYRAFFGLSSPRNKILGMELSGVVEKLGKGCTRFAVGDRIASDTSDFGFGTFAEYIALSEKALTPILDSMDFATAASLPHASLLAKQGIDMAGGVKDGASVLLNGAGGGVGTIALQILRDKCSRIVGVDTGAKLEKMLELGFDEVIDYKKVNFTKGDEKFDFILDAKTSYAPKHYKRVLKSGGSYISVGGKTPRLIGLLKYNFLLNRFSDKKLDILGLKANEGLSEIFQLWEKGKIKSIIDGPYPFAESAKTLHRFINAEHFGKIVVDVEG